MNNKNYFLLRRNKNESLLCSWFENQPNYFNRKVYYIGVSNGLGGYKYMLSQGWIDRRNNKIIKKHSKLKIYKFNKYLKNLNNY